MSKISLSLSLVKENVTAIEDILKDVAIPSCSIDNIGMLYYKNSNTKEANKIMNFFGNKLPAANENGERRPTLYTAYVQAVLLITRRIDEVERIFLVTFGMGRNLIKTDCIQDKFGMYVVLNSIDPNTIRSVDVKVLESVPLHDRIQSTKLSRINTFDLNPERDLLRALTGKTKDADKEVLGETVTGADSLKISIEIDIDHLSERLGEIFAISKRTDYREHYGFVDHISPIKSEDLRRSLNEELINKLNNKELDLVWMSIPELVNWEEINTIRYTPHGYNYFDLDIRTLLSDVYIDNPVNLELLRKKRVYAYNALDNEIDSWSVYRCICADFELNGNQYILSNGQWYSIKEDFSHTINEFYRSVPLAELQLEKARLNESEGDYNVRVVNIDSAHRLLMDKRLVKPSQGLDEIEFCDIYTTNKELVHVKRYSGSATLSHLFNQGFVSGELLLQRVFREQLNAKLETMENEVEHRDLNAWKVNVAERDFHHEEYKVIYAIITNKEGDRPSIPFFSKVSFRQVCQRLKDYGYQVSLMKIGIDENDDANPELTSKRNEKTRKAKENRGAEQIARRGIIQE